MNTPNRNLERLRLPHIITSWLTLARLGALNACKNARRNPEALMNYFLKLHQPASPLASEAVIRLDMQVDLARSRSKRGKSADLTWDVNIEVGGLSRSLPTRAISLPEFNPLSILLSAAFPCAVWRTLRRSTQIIPI